MKRWRGLKDLVLDAIDKGSAAVQRVHEESAKRPFQILELIPPIAAPARGVRLVHDTIVTGTYGAIRLANRALGVAAGVVIDVVEERKTPPPSVSTATK